MFNNKEYWENRLQNHYDLIGVGDISLSANYNKWSYKVTEKVLTRLFKKYTKGNQKVLDFGSGTGFVVDIWKKLGMDVIGVDISATAVKNLSNKYPEFNFIEFDMGEGELPVDDDSIACCSASSVLYHIVDDNALDITLQNVHRILKEGGYFIFSDNFIHKSQFNITHQRCRTLEEYEEILKKNNFEVVERVPNYVLMNDPVDAQSKFYPRVWSRTTSMSKRSSFFDSIIWRLLYPVELILVNVMKESPAQEIIVCKAI